MKEMISLKPMTPEMYHAFFQEYENDMELYIDKNDFTEYVYNREKVDAYIQKQISLKRLPVAIMCGEEMVGELKLYDIVSGKSATLGITMKSKKYKDKGYGTQAERLAIDFVFNELDIPVLYADSILTNTRSQHVLEKVGFQFLYADEQRKHYRITKDK